jgi:hypothetical protein
MAVGGVCSELVSGRSSLICRENTGKYTEIGRPGEAVSVIGSLFGAPPGVFPDFGNREFHTNEQGLPGLESTSEGAE